MVVLRSAPGAIYSLGSGYFLAMIAFARRQTPSGRCLGVLDCADAPGFALAALAAGAEAVALRTNASVTAKVAAIARSHDALLLDHCPSDSLDPGRARDIRAMVLDRLSGRLPA